MLETNGWKEDELPTLIPMARAVLTLTSSPSLRELPLLSFNASTGTFLKAAITGICFVSHLGLQSAAKSTTYKVIHLTFFYSKSFFSYFLKT
jgi:hypothetical protein